MAVGYKCEGCGIVRAERWTGQCPGCGGYAAIRRCASAEGVEQAPPPRGVVTPLNDVTAASLERISTGFPGIDRVLGADPVTGECGVAAKGGQAIQIYGSPGSGKSTMILQWCREWTKQRYGVLYVAGEESLQQVKTRADRIGKFNNKMHMIEEQDLDSILYALDDDPPTFAVIDSIQTVSVEDYAAGSQMGMKIATRELYRFTQTRGIGLIIVTQMNKGVDDFSGPKELEHTVDTSAYLRTEKDGTRTFEISGKNRFGNTPASQKLAMTSIGLVEILDDAPEEEDEVEEKPEVKPEAKPAAPPKAPLKLSERLKARKKAAPALLSVPMPTGEVPEMVPEDPAGFAPVGATVLRLPEPPVPPIADPSGPLPEKPTVLAPPDPPVSPVSDPSGSAPEKPTVSELADRLVAEIAAHLTPARVTAAPAPVPPIHALPRPFNPPRVMPGLQPLSASGLKPPVRSPDDDPPTAPTSKKRRLSFIP